MFEKIFDFIAQYLSGFVIVAVAITTFLGCVYIASLTASNESRLEDLGRLKTCMQLNATNCF